MLNPLNHFLLPWTLLLLLHIDGLYICLCFVEAGLGEYVFYLSLKRKARYGSIKTKEKYKSKKAVFQTFEKENKPGSVCVLNKIKDLIISTVINRSFPHLSSSRYKRSVFRHQHALSYTRSVPSQRRICVLKNQSSSRCGGVWPRDWPVLRQCSSKSEQQL